MMLHTDIKKVLTIAGSDCSGGAGIQADIKTITAHAMYAMSAVTALTAQNTTGVYGILEADPAFVCTQLDCIFRDIRPDAVKIGMISNKEIISAIAQKLTGYHAEHIVVDPVMVSTSGSRLMNDNAVATLIAELFPFASVITPNIPEAEVLCAALGAPLKITDTREMLQAAQIIAPAVKQAVLIKGGHLPAAADDVLYMRTTDAGQEAYTAHWYTTARIDNPNTHGTGCTLSSAIACNLAAGHTMQEAVQRAKNYVSGAIADGLNLGNGSGPLNHCWQLKPHSSRAH